MARIAKSLDVLRTAINTAYPNRSKISDGWIGDAAHQATASDHNPNAAGVVTALDITHDPDDGPDTWALAEILRQNRDPRIKYVISNGRIFAGAAGPSPWVWRAYTGANKHAHHVHVSVIANPSFYDSEAGWKLSAAGAVEPAPVPPRPKGITADMRQRMMKAIMGYEGKIPPVVFIAPDGRPEIAGITQKDHPAKYAELKALLDAGKTQQAVDGVIAYYLQYTAPAQNWTDRAGPEFFLRDSILNRGPDGGAEILQMALGVPIDHQVGPTTRGALAALDPNVAIDKMRAAREVYENKHFDNGNGKAWRQSRKQWDGLVSRWNKAQAQAKAFQREQGTAGLEAVITTTTVVVGTGTVAAVDKSKWTGADIAMAAFSVGVAALVAFIVIRAIRRRV